MARGAKRERVAVEVGQIREDPDGRRVEILKVDGVFSWYAGDERPAVKVKRLDSGKITRINRDTLSKWKVIS